MTKDDNNDDDIEMDDQEGGLNEKQEEQEGCWGENCGYQWTKAYWTMKYFYAFLLSPFLHSLAKKKLSLHICDVFNQQSRIFMFFI